MNYVNIAIAISLAALAIVLALVTAGTLLPISIPILMFALKFAGVPMS